MAAGGVLKFVIIFDFDGTIADSFEAILTITNRLAVEYGYKPADREDVKRFQALTSREVLREANISLFMLPFLLRRLQTELNQQIGGLQPIDGMEEALRSLKQQGHQLGIVTSNSPENVTTFLEACCLQALFDFTYSRTRIFGKDRVLRRILQQKHIAPTSVIYVGDETRDIEAAKRIPVRAIAVTWGFNTRDALAAFEPDGLVDTPAELIQLIQQLQGVGGP